MTDAFDRAMADIAIKSAANGGPTTQDILTAMQASHKAALQRSDELSSAIKRIVSHLESESGSIRRTVADVMKEHMEWTEAVPMVRLAAVEERVDAWEDGCPAREAAILDKHVDFHEATFGKHMVEHHGHAAHRSDDPDDADYRSDRTPCPTVRGSQTWLFVVIGIVVVALAVVATLEFADHEEAAGRALLILMPVVTVIGLLIAALRR